ncbi:CLUMA_CG012788, isoform A [Clunio marinus]|uniref:CLUMA_CG012788, isoform A n=1 Tax=Clunio marinus TaxID=568069 RepID=A0A1J1IGF9_9DIPT|nr:CLUMA_CG012788, isoform A [Clunio marinus]
MQWMITNKMIKFKLQIDQEKFLKEIGLRKSEPYLFTNRDELLTEFQIADRSFSPDGKFVELIKDLGNPKIGNSYRF